MSIFFDRFSDLCRNDKTSPNAVAKELGISSGSITAWKRGVTPRSDTVQTIAEYFCVSIDYLLGRSDDPIDYNNDGDALADISTVYSAGTNGDMKRAKAVSDAVTKDALQERRGQMQSNQLRAAFFNGYANELSDQELDDIWNDAKEYAKFKAQQKLKMKGKKDT